MLKQEFCSMLRCPESGQRLALAEPALVDRLNTAIAGGQVCNRAGRLVTEIVDGALRREDGLWLYPVRGELPVLLIDEAISFGK